MIVTCRDLTEAVTDKKEGSLSAVDRAGYAVHLAWCRRCRNYVKQIDLTIETIKHLPEPPLPDEMRAALLSRFRSAHKRS